MPKDILISKTERKQLTTLELARRVKQNIQTIEERISFTGTTIDPQDKRGTFREEVGHYLPLSPYKPPISVEGHVEVDDNGFLVGAGVVLEYDRKSVPEHVQLEAAQAPLRDRRFKRNMSSIDLAEERRILGK